MVVVVAVEEAGLDDDVETSRFLFTMLGGRWESVETRRGDGGGGGVGDCSDEDGQASEADLRLFLNGGMQRRDGMRVG